MPQFIIKSENIQNKQIILTKNDPEFHHIIDVMRTKIGEILKFISYQNNQYLAKFIEFDKHNQKAYFEILEEKCYSKTNEFVLFQCIPKQKKMDFIIEKAVELGVNKIVPVISKNVVVDFDEKSAFKKLEKWQNVVISAVKQSGNGFITELENIRNFNDIVKNCYDENAINLIAWEHGTEILEVTNTKKVNLIVGAEGGFDKKEIELAENIGWKSFRLKGNILRAETAPIVLISIIKYELGLL